MNLDSYLPTENTLWFSKKRSRGPELTSAPDSHRVLILEIMDGTLCLSFETDISGYCLLVHTNRSDIDLSVKFLWVFISKFALILGCSKCQRCNRRLFGFCRSSSDDPLNATTPHLHSYTTTLSFIVYFIPFLLLYLLMYFNLLTLFYFKNFLACFILNLMLCLAYINIIWTLLY